MLAESSRVTLKFTKIMMKQKTRKILNQVPKPLMKVSLAGKLVEGRNRRS